MIESAVVQARGEIGLLDAAMICSALRWETHGALCARWLRQSFDSLSAADRLAYSREVARASSERDRCIRALGIEAKPEDFWKRLYSTPALEVASKPPAAPADAPAEPDGRQDQGDQGATQATLDGQGGPRDGSSK